MTNEISYEQQRLQNIKANEALLLSLGLDVPKAKPAPKPVPKVPKTPTLRKTVVARGTPATDAPDTPSSTISTSSNGSLRRSGRARGIVDYSNSGLRAAAASRSDLGRAASRVTSSKRGRSGKDVADEDGFNDDHDDGDDDEDDGDVGRQRKAQRLGVRLFDPKTFGSIPGIEVGTWWPSRMDCSTAAIHAPTVAGISGNAEVGAWSVALSGGYADDVDLGEAFTYTGSGGRDLKGTKQNPKNLRTAPQSFDQSFKNSFNAALKKSAETRKPVRVIRGFKLDSPYAPPEGYRYDGLYIVEKAWMAKGLTKGLKVCRYAFKRMPGQEPLPVREEEAD